MPAPRHDLLSTNENRLSVGIEIYRRFNGSSAASTAPELPQSNSAPRMTVIDFAEARKTKRRRVLDTGLIRFGDMSICRVRPRPPTDCEQHNIGSQIGIPQQFTLIVVPKKKIYSCSVVWRKERRIGVAFY
jgi:hypothetical protein